MHSTTPRDISPSVLALCAELVKEPHPVYLDVTSVQRAGVNDCFQVVENHVRQHGGTVCYGWQIWEWPLVFIEAEFHAVWRDNKGALHELTPKQLPVQRILFLPDPARVYEGRQVNNVRRPLSSHADVNAFIEASNAQYELLNRGDRAHQHGEIVLAGAEAREQVAISDRLQTAYESILARLGNIGRNDLCPCGSGKKFKKCHGR